MSKQCWLKLMESALEILKSLYISLRNRILWSARFHKDYDALLILLLNQLTILKKKSLKWTLAKLLSNIQVLCISVMNLTRDVSRNGHWNWYATEIGAFKR